MWIIFKTLFHNSHGFSEVTVNSFNNVVKLMIPQDQMLTSLVNSKIEARAVRLCSAMLLSGTYSMIKLKSVLIQKIKEAFNPCDLTRQALKTLHEFGLKSGYNQLLNMDHIEMEFKHSNQVQLVSRKFAVLVPESYDRLSSFNIASLGGHAYYSWNIFRMDDFDFTTKEYSISPRLKQYWFEDKSPVSTNPVLDYKATNDADACDGVATELTWIRPRMISSKRGSSRQICRSSDEQVLQGFMRCSKSKKMELALEDKELEIDSIETLFEYQEMIDKTYCFDASCYDKLKSKEQELAELKPKVAGTKYDDAYVLFHGLTNIESSLYDRNHSELDFKNFYSAPNAMVMKCYKSEYEHDLELKNLIKSLGCQFSCLPKYILPQDIEASMMNDDSCSSDRNSSEILVVQGVCSMCYLVVNNDVTTLRTLINYYNGTPDSQGKHTYSKKRTMSNSSQMALSENLVLILYGFESEIAEFKANNKDILQTFGKIITLSKSFDVDVLQLQAVQRKSPPLYAKSSESTSCSNEQEITRELVSIPFIENRLYSIVNN